MFLIFEKIHKCYIESDTPMMLTSDRKHAKRFNANEVTAVLRSIPKHFQVQVFGILD